MSGGVLFTYADALAAGIKPGDVVQIGTHDCKSYGMIVGPSPEGEQFASVIYTLERGGHGLMVAPVDMEVSYCFVGNIVT